MTHDYISFNPFRSIGIPSVKHLKPENMYARLSDIQQAEYILFPEYWQVNALVYALKKKIFPSISSYHLGHDKVEMTRSLMAFCPVNVLDTGIYSSASIEFDVLADRFGVPFVCKEIRSSCGLGVFLIQSKEEFCNFARQNPVVYAQKYLEMDRDMRIVIIGNQVVAAYWKIRAPGSFHNNVARGGHIDRTNIPAQVVDVISGVALALDIDHAGFDVAISEEGIFLLEFNLFFGTKGILETSSLLGSLIHHYLQSR